MQRSFVANCSCFFFFLPFHWKRTKYHLGKVKLSSGSLFGFLFLLFFFPPRGGVFLTLSRTFPRQTRFSPAATEGESERGNVSVLPINNDAYEKFFRYSSLAINKHVDASFLARSQVSRSSHSCLANFAICGYSSNRYGAEALSSFSLSHARNFCEIIANLVTETSGLCAFPSESAV